MKKYISVLFLIALIIPSVTLAFWWNPFSWKVFTKVFHKEKVVEVQQQKENQPENMEQKTSEEKIQELQKQLDELKNKQIAPSPLESISEIKNEVPVVDNSVKIKTEIPVKTPITLEPPSSNSENVEPLKISNVKNKVVGSNVTLTWETNLPTESTLSLIESVEKVYQSDKGLSTSHSVTIFGLTYKDEYNYKIRANTEDKKQTDTYYGLFFVLEKFIANLGEYDEDKCQTIILIDSNGRLKNKQVLVGLYNVQGGVISYGEIKLTTNSGGEIKYCDKPHVNQYKIYYLDHTVTLKR